MFQLIWPMQESMVCTKIGDPFHLNSFPHMEVVTFMYFFYCIIKLRVLWNTTTMTQNWNISRLEVLCLTTKLVHILYFCSVCSLIKNSFQISIKLRYIRIKESVHSISSRVFLIEGALNIFFISTCHWFFFCLILVVRSWTVSSMYAPLKYCCVGTKTLFWSN